VLSWAFQMKRDSNSKMPSVIANKRAWHEKQSKLPVRKKTAHPARTAASRAPAHCPSPAMRTTDDDRVLTRTGA
jgi:hypothetical protein